MYHCSVLSIGGIRTNDPYRLKVNIDFGRLTLSTAWVQARSFVCVSYSFVSFHGLVFLAFSVRVVACSLVVHFFVKLFSFDVFLFIGFVDHEYR